MPTDDEPKKRKPQDISKMRLNIPTPKGTENLSANAMGDAQSAADALMHKINSEDFEKRVASLGGASAIESMADKLREQVSGFGGLGQTSTAENYSSAAEAVRLQMSDLLRTIEPHSALGDVARNIVAQQDSLDNMKRRQLVTSTAPVLPHIHSAENPVFETNTRLGRIEDQFDRVAEMAKESAQITVGLQSNVAGFLHIFQKAASDSNIAGKLTMGVAVIAIFISLGQIFAPSYLVDPESEALRLEIVDLKAKIIQSQQEQVATSQQLVDAVTEGNDANTRRLIDAIASGDTATAEAVRKGIAEALAAKPPVANEK